ncbi:MAG: N-carbamoylputrescine amidase [Myxococcota bacterium]
MTTVAAIQCSMGDSRQENVERVVNHIRDAAAQGARIVLAPELFEGRYFPRSQSEEFFAWAQPRDNPTALRLSKLANELNVVIPYSFFEREGSAYYNSLLVFDADGTALELYRKSHIPDGPGYQEKYYFRPGDTGFRVWSTRHGKIGVGICWDQWFPEAARAMVLKGAELLFYPTAIGSEPASGEDTRDPWQRVMIGHAVANSVPVIAANRVGLEGEQRFYGSSFIADPRGDKIGELGDSEEGVVMATFDQAELRQRRDAWGFFRDRRPELYRVLLSADGREELQ